MILMIDNYDSFTFNLVQYIEQIGYPVKVVRNDAATVEEIADWNPSGIVISPGPGRPENAGVSIPLIEQFSGQIPILGVCLGHQAIAVTFGGQVVSAQYLMHGKTSSIKADGEMLYQGLKKPFKAMRYHSLAVARNTLPDCLKITAEADDGEVMGIRHVSHPTEGIQFHPESIMTTVGKRLLRNFLQQTGNGNTADN